MSVTHIPVMKDEVISYIKAKEGGKFIDGTIGLGGHTIAILSSNEKNFVYGFEKDPCAIEISKNSLSQFEGRYRLFNDDFRNMFERNIPFEEIRGYLFDLGVSSLQVETPERGFSYLYDGELDMRMNPSSSLSAKHILNSYPFEKLAQIFKDYGEIPFGEKIAKLIVERRKIKKFEKTSELRDLIREKYRRRKSRDLLSRVFQAIRIEVNSELEGLEEFFQKIPSHSSSGARIVVISFHSLEDRKVKCAFRKLKEEGKIKIISKKVIKPKREEVLSNKRARSAKMRVVEVS